MMTMKHEKCIASETPVSLFLHFFGFLWYCFGIYHDRHTYVVPIYMAFGGRFQHLTMTTAYMIFAATGIASLVDCIQIITHYYKYFISGSKHCAEFISVLISIRDELMCSFVFTFGTLVSILYWICRAIVDPTITTREYEKVIPVFGWYNQFLHTVPLFYSVVLMANINYQYTTISRAVFTLVTFDISFCCWLFYCFYVNGFWAYGYFKILSMNEIILTLSLVSTLSILAYLSCRKLSILIWKKATMDRTLIKAEQKQH